MIHSEKLEIYDLLTPCTRVTRSNWCHAHHVGGHLGLRVLTSRRLKCALHCITHSLELYIKMHSKNAHEYCVFKIFLMMTSGELGQQWKLEQCNAWEVMWRPVRIEISSLLDDNSYMCTVHYFAIDMYGLWTNLNHVLCLQEDKSGQIYFFMKGADSVMNSIVQYNDWLDEEVFYWFTRLLKSYQK